MKDSHDRGNGSGTKPKILDLFCGAGGASVGYARAGFEVIGVDIKPQPHYPFEFHQDDALEFPLEGYDAYHASPPCQAYSEATPCSSKIKHVQLINVVRSLFVANGKPYVIENVDGARTSLRNPISLHGSMFGLNVYWSRYFEINPENLIVLLRKRYHFPNPVLPTGQSRKRRRGKRVNSNSVKEVRDAMGIDWMTKKELTQSIPPAYTEYIGKHLIASLGVVRHGYYGV